jgi:hypothetical protein
MNMMRFAEKQENHDTYCVAWLHDGKSFVIRDADAFTRQVIPQFFKATKFSSFTRKLYRWGFRQVNRGIGPDDPIIFGNEYFQRDHADMMVKMRSITAGNVIISTSQKKRRASGMPDEEDDARKRMYAQQMEIGASGIKQQQTQNQMNNMGLNLASALRPNFAMLQQMQQHQEQQKRLSLQINNFQHAAHGMHQQHNQQQHMNNNNNMQQHMNNLYLPQQQQFHQQQHQQMNFQQQQMQGVQQFPAASTADIVNAAINALRFAS